MRGLRLVSKLRGYLKVFWARLLKDFGRKDFFLCSKNTLVLLSCSYISVLTSVRPEDLVDSLLEAGRKDPDFSERH